MLVQLPVFLVALCIAGKFVVGEQTVFDVVWMPVAENPSDTQHEYFQKVFDGVRSQLERIPGNELKFGIFLSKEDVNECLEVYQGLTSSAEVGPKVFSTPEIKQARLEVVPFYAINKTATNPDYGWRYYDPFARHSIFYVVTSSAELHDLVPVLNEHHVCGQNLVIDYGAITNPRVYIFAVVPQSEKQKWERHMSFLSLQSQVYAYDVYIPRDDPYGLGYDIATKMQKLYRDERDTPRPRAEPKSRQWYEILTDIFSPDAAYLDSLRNMF